MDITVMAILIVIVGSGVAFGIYVILKRKKNERKKFQNQGKNVFVQDGIDIRRQVLGPDKGAYFTGNLERQGTNIVNSPFRSVWQISFRNIDNGQIFQYCFGGHMWIGRARAYPGEVSLVLADDRMVSKTHCMIYELEGKLCLNDCHSKNHTYMNGVRVDAPVYLENRCILKVGDTRLEVEFGR